MFDYAPTDTPKLIRLIKCLKSDKFYGPASHRCHGPVRGRELEGLLQARRRVRDLVLLLEGLREPDEGAVTMQGSSGSKLSGTWTIIVTFLRPEPSWAKAI